MGAGDEFVKFILGVTLCVYDLAEQSVSVWFAGSGEVIFARSLANYAMHPYLIAGGVAARDVKVESPGSDGLD